MTAQVMVFRCGGFAAATKNIFFMFFLPCWGGFRRFPRRRPQNRYSSTQTPFSRITPAYQRPLSLMYRFWVS